MTASPAIRALAKLVEAELGICFPDDQALSAKLGSVVKRLGLESLGALERLVRNDPLALRQHVFPALTVGETYFFRNQAQFDALGERIIPSLRQPLGAESPLVIWVAGCATGEEAYSLAIWVRENAPDLWPRLQIVATDINADFLARAERGRYEEWSFRQTEQKWRQRYFTSCKGGGWQIDGALGEVIHFRQHNLNSKTLPGGLLGAHTSLIFCRNVLIYFGASAVKRALDLFEFALRPSGVLMLGHAESLTALRLRWTPEYYPGTFFYRSPRADSEQTVKSDVVRYVRPITKETTKQVTPPVAPVEQEPNNELAVARACADSGDLTGARVLLEQIVRQDRTNVEAHLLSAIVSEELGDKEAARAALCKALFLDRTLVVGHYLLAVNAERSGDLAEALRRYRTVCRLAHTNNEVDLPFGHGVSANRLREISRMRAEELARSARREA